MKNLIAYKYQNGYYHKGCKGAVSVGGFGHRQVPIGFGFMPGDHKFSVSCARIKIIDGFCMKCSKQGYFDVSKPKLVIKYPRKINRKLEVASNV